MKKNLIQVRFADFQIAVAAAVCVDADQITGFEKTDVGRKSPVRHFQSLSQIIHAHSPVVQQKLKYFNADFGTERAKDFELLVGIFDVSHGGFSSLSCFRV